MNKKPERKAKAAKKPAAAKGSKPSSAKAPATRTKRDRLERELSGALKEIDEQGLQFLLNQAHVMMHNAQVEKINRELAELEKKNRAVREAASPAQAAVRIEESDNRKIFYLALGGQRKVLSLEELKRIVRICYAAESKSAALRQLYTLFSRERSDILFDAKIGNYKNPLLEGLFHAVREKYRLEDR